MFLADSCAQVSSIAISPSLSHLAVGISDGTVLLYRHLDQSLFSGALSLSALPKPKVIHESSNEAITGLAFRSSSAPSSPEASTKELLHLFIVTTNRLLTYLASSKGSGGAPVLVDDIGCGLGCAVINEKLGEMAVARDEAIYMYSPAGRGACYAVECERFASLSANDCDARSVRAEVVGLLLPKLPCHGFPSFCPI